MSPTATLILDSVSALIRIGTASYEASKAGELELLKSVEDWFRRGADAVAQLIASYDDEHEKTMEAFKAARERINAPKP